MSRLPPSFGPYQPIRRLGAGGMAETFAAVKRGPGKFEQHVCIKRILPSYESDQEFVEGFLHEAKTSATLRHANIVQVLDFGYEESTYYLALELVDGCDLRALLRESAHSDSRLDAELAALIAADLCAALEHAHSADQGRLKVVHRDISPSNVLISRAGEVKLTDFGIARAVGGTHRTAAGVIKGKLPYMPPEYIDGQPFDEQGDLFSLGVLLYELLAGRRPFDGDSDVDTIRRIITGVYTPLHELTDAVPKPLEQCVERLLALQREHRFASAREVLDALPPMATHRVRPRLAELVRTRTAAPTAERPDPLAGTDAAPPTASASAAPSVTAPARPAATPLDPLAAPTRTLPLSSELATPLPRSPSARAWVTLALACASLLAVVSVAALMRSKAAVPKVPSAMQTPSPPAAAPPELSIAHAAEEPSTTNLKPADEPPPQHEGSPPEEEAASDQLAELKVIVYPFGDVWVDGKRIGHSPITTKVLPGSHDIRFGEGRPTELRTVQVHAGQHERIEIHRKVSRDTHP